MSLFTKHKHTRLDKANSLSKNATKKEKRKIEQQLLQPEKLPKYTGPTPKHKSDLESRTVLIVFKSKEQMERIGVLFDIRTSVKGTNYITNIDILDDIAKKVQKGKYVVVNGVLLKAHKKKRKKNKKKAR